MSTLRVSFDHQIFDFQRYGGVSRYLVETAAHLARDPQCHVTVIAPLHMNQYLRSLDGSVRQIGVYAGGVPRSRRALRAVNALVGPTLLRSTRPDIVHRTYYAADQARVKGARSVITVHDLIHERLGHAMAHDVHARDKRRAVEQADHAICVSESTRRDLIELFDVDPRKTSVVHHGFSLMPGPADDRVAIPDRPYILYVGLRGRYKNFRVLLDAYRASAELRRDFDMVCFGGGPFSAEESQAIATSGARGSAIRQLGGSDDVLRQLYRRAAVFVYPSLYEGFGIPPLEAMSFQCPVVCCPVASIPEVVGDAAEFFDPHDVDSLVQAILRVTGDDEYRSALVHRGTVRLSRFSWARSAEQTLATYKSLM